VDRSFDFGPSWNYWELYFASGFDWNCNDEGKSDIAAPDYVI
jgi:hypothetical protein